MNRQKEMREEMELANDVDWSSMITKDGLAKLSQKFSSRFLARHVPLEAQLVGHIVTAPEGWKCWHGNYRQILLQRLLGPDQDELWISLHEQGGDALKEIFAHAITTQARQLRKLWVGLRIWGICQTAPREPRPKFRVGRPTRKRR